MNKSLFHEAVCALFIAQYNNIPLSFGKIVTIAVTATAASIGAAAVPGAGLITLIIVVQAVNLQDVKANYFFKSCVILIWIL